MQYGIPRLDRPGEEALGGGMLASRLGALLDLRADDLLIGIGSGSADACRALLGRVALRSQIVLVAPSGAGATPPPSATGLRVADMSALEFAHFPMHCDKILLDGALIDPDGGGPLLPLLFDRLEANGRLVTLLHAPGPSVAGARGRAAAVAAQLHESGFRLLFDSLEDPPGRYDLVGGMKPARV